MPIIEIHEYTEGGTTVRSYKHENEVASLALGQTRDGATRCRLTVGGIVDELAGLDATATLDTADPRVVKTLLDHDWSNVAVTRAMCWRLIFERMTPEAFRTFCVSIAQAAWRQGRDDARAVTARALGFDTVGVGALTPAVIARVLE